MSELRERFPGTGRNGEPGVRGPASYYRVQSGAHVGRLLGTISPMTDPHLWGL